MPSGLATWEIDPQHSSVTFKVRHLGISWVHGTVKNVRGTVTFDPADPQKLTMQATMDVKELSTGVLKRDEHLMSEEFFDEKNHPHITFDTGKVKMIGEGAFEIIGILTIRGVTKNIPMRLQLGGIADNKGEQRIAFSGAASINRRDFGINWGNKSDTGEMVAGNEVGLEIDVEGIRK